MPTIRLVNDKTFTADASTSILDSAQCAGLMLEHGCRTGRCGTCRTRVLEGSTTALLSEEGLTKQERDEGWILSCARAPQTDVRLSLEDLGALAGITVKTVPCRIDSLTPMAPDVMKAVLRLPPANNPEAEFNYLSGQYINVIGKDGMRRSYSIASPSQGQDFSQTKLELHIRRVAGGAMSAYWFEQAKVNDLLRLEGPFGTFFLRDCTDQDVIFLATGTGIAPIKAMLDDVDRLLPARRPRSITLLWGGRKEQDLYWSPTSQGLTYLPVLSRADAGWQGAQGHVQQVLLSQPQPRDWANTVVYACGSNTMIQSARAALLAAGLPDNKFHSDAFVSSAAAGPAQASSCQCG